MIYRAAQFTRFIAPTHAFGGVSSAAVIDDETVETNFIALRAPDRNIRVVSETCWSLYNVQIDFVHEPSCWLDAEDHF